MLKGSRVQPNLLPNEWLKQAKYKIRFDVTSPQTAITAAGRKYQQLTSTVTKALTAVESAMWLC